MRSTSLECQPRAQLEATLKHLIATDGDKELIARIRDIANQKALSTLDEAGFPRALKDEQDEFTF